MDYDEQEEELVMAGGGGASYDDDDSSLANPTRVKMPSPVDDPAAMMVVVRNTGKGKYRECLKNHAVGMGGYALDGCLEFMAAGPEGTIDALKCAACDCHRNFHRKDAAAFPGDHPYHPFHHRRHQPPPGQPQYAACYRATPAGYLHVAGPNRGSGAATLALPIGGGPQGARELMDHDDVSDRSGGGGEGSNSRAGKRFRTKFTHEQKEKMLEFAESAGWRIQRHDDNVVEEFCNEIGVKRHVLKVWMHNNKHTLGKKP
ncbi:zinc-finger homeodomain protein 1-like [Lotus japonicus]|uniref:zinc-finger homeodomain protein 1-like n=1 Tax=Lotus japonicus TaxID=34305 RepID=UPI002588B753|nr:zinc-finger homeodomain protein 1-like [Lotus japonicus]